MNIQALALLHPGYVCSAFKVNELELIERMLEIEMNRKLRSLIVYAAFGFILSLGLYVVLIVRSMESAVAMRAALFVFLMYEIAIVLMHVLGLLFKKRS